MIHLKIAALLCAMAALLVIGVACGEEDAPENPPQAFAKAVKELHPSPFVHMSEADFDAKVAQLESRWPQLLERGEAGYALQALAAALGDEHTSVAFYPQDDAQIPFMVMKIEDQYIVMQAQNDCVDMVGKALVSIGGVPMEDVEARIAAYLSYETEQWRSVQAAQVINSMRMLRQIGVVADMTGLTVVTQDTQTSQTQTFELGALTGGYDYRTSTLLPSLPRTFGQSGYYYATLLEGGEVFIQYNVCEENPDLPMKDFAAALLAQVTTPPVKTIVDLRHNSGGNSEIINPLLDALAQWQAQGTKLYALIGPETFSSGMMDAQKLAQMGATLVGGTTGGVLGFGELKEVQLGDGLVLYCSSVDFSGGGEHAPLQAHVQAPQTIADLLAGVDTAVQAVRTM